MHTQTPKLRFPEFTDKWEVKKLGEIAIVNPKNKALPNNFIYIDLESVEKGVLLKESRIELEDAPSRAQRLLIKNDILFQTVRPYQKNNLFFDKDEKDYVASTGYAHLRTKNNSRYLFQILHTENFVNKVMLRCTGTSYPAINSTDLATIKIAIPQLPEQTKIANFLTAIDEKIQALKQRKTLLEQYKKGIMQQIFSQELRFKNDDGTPFPDWEEKNLGEIGTFVGGGTPSTKEINYWKGNIPWLSSSDLIDESIFKLRISRFITERAIEESATKLIPKKSILIVSRVGVGKVAVNEVDVCTSQDFASLIPVNDNYIFLAYLIKIKTNKLLEFNQGTSIKGFVKSDLEGLKLELPSLPEQQKIANFLTAIDEKIEKVNEHITTTETYKKGLLQQMFI